MQRGSSRTALGLIGASVLLLILGLVTRWRRVETPTPPPTREPPATAAAPAPPPTARAVPAPAAPGTAPRRDAAPGPGPELFAEDDASAGTWAALDLDAVREALPDNVYWKLAAPTKDPELLRWREEERARWNREYGKVLSNTATAAEVDAYFAERKRVSDDYLEFVVHVLTNYGGAIPKEGVAMLKLAGELHAARLEELPRQQAEAHARREAHDAARRAWLEEQKAFEQPADPTR